MIFNRNACKIQISTRLRDRYHLVSTCLMCCNKASWVGNAYYFFLTTILLFNQFTHKCIFNKVLLRKDIGLKIPSLAFLSVTWYPFPLENRSGVLQERILSICWLIKLSNDDRAFHTFLHAIRMLFQNNSINSFPQSCVCRYINTL